MKSINELNADLFADDIDEKFASPLEARKKAMDFLARREYGRDELIRKLETRGFISDVAAESVDQLAADGLQDDRRFIESFIQSRIRQGKGPVRVAQELDQKGLGAGLVEQVLGEVDVDWRELAADVRQKKFRGGVPANFDEKARQMRFLQYRGFDAGQIQSAMTDVE